MAGGTRGFTIIELMIVITIIVIIALIAVPNMISGRLIANETAAIQTLRSIATAQNQFTQWCLLIVQFFEKRYHDVVAH